MSLRDGILANLFHTTATVERRTVSLDAIGDPSESWAVILDSVQAAIRNSTGGDKKTEDRTLEQGKQYTYHAKGFLPGSVSPAPKAGDRLTDDETGTLYSIVGVYAQYPAHQPTTTIHHYKLLLELVNAPKS